MPNTHAPSPASADLIRSTLDALRAIRDGGTLDGAADAVPQGHHPAPDDAPIDDGTTSQPTQPASPWPPGPGQGGAAMLPDDVQTWATHLLTHPVFADALEPGISRRRMLPLLAETHTEHASTLMVWLLRAGLLADPPLPAMPWRKPRALLSRDLMVLAARLRETPLPSAADLAQARLEGLK